MRLIDAEKLAEVLNRYLAAPHVQLRNNDISVGLRMGINTCLTFLNNAKTIDAVPVVRCKDCEYGKEETDSCTFNYFCSYDGCAWNNGDHFCGYGERKKQ